MKLRTAFHLLQPQTASYEAVYNAYAAFMARYAGDHDLMQLAETAKETLIEKDVYWFCPDDFVRYTQETATNTVLTEIQQRLRAVRAMPGVKIMVKGSWMWITGPTSPYEHDLKTLGFIWRPRKQAWTWCPADMN